MSLVSRNRDKDDKESTMNLNQVSERKKLNGQSYKMFMKSLCKKPKGSDTLVQEKETSRSKANVTEPSGSNKDEKANADTPVKVSSSPNERLDFLLRRVRSPRRRQGSKSPDGITPAKDKKKNLTEISTNLDTSKPEEKSGNVTPEECKSTSINFVEYWIPVKLSDVQTEQYCGTLFSNSSLLCPPNKISAEKLHDILISARKCCDHPYLANPSLRASLVKGDPEPGQLDAEIKLSSKLVLLHKMLMEIKERGLRVLILYQPLGGDSPVSNGDVLDVSNGDILDDIMHHKFGEDSFVRVNGEMSPRKRRNVLSTFNDNKSKQFVCLMETRSCIPRFRFESLDTVIFFNSDWDPLNDLRVLQKISLDSQVERVNVFRLYSAHTVEEKLLFLAKRGQKLDFNIINTKQSTLHGLLAWGARHLFKNLDRYHNLSSPESHIVASTGDSFLDDVFLEFSTLLQNKGHTDNSLIMEAEAIEGIYPTSIMLHGEADNLEEMAAKNKSYVFWTKLFEGRNPRWKYFSRQAPRTRKVVHCFRDLSVAFAGEEIAIKRSLEDVKSKSCQVTPVGRKRIRNKPLSQDKKRKRSDSCPVGGGKRGRKVKCISGVNGQKETMASWIQREIKCATRKIPVSAVEHDDHLPASTTAQDGQARETTGPSFKADEPIDPPVDDPVRPTEDGIGPNNVRQPHNSGNVDREETQVSYSQAIGNRIGPINASLPHNSENFQPPEGSQCSQNQALKSVCRALEMEFESLQKEKNQKLKLHEEMKLRTKLACEKEIDEIRKKFDTVIQNAEVVFLQENQALELKCKTLAETMSLLKNPTMTTPSPVTTNSSMEEINQQISQLNEPPTNVTGSTIVPVNQPISPLPGYSIVQMLNQGSTSAVIPSPYNHVAISPQPATYRPPNRRFPEIANISATAYRYDRSTSSQLYAPAIQGMIHSLGNFQGGYSSVRAPAPHLRNITFPWHITSPSISPRSTMGVNFSPVSYPQVTPRMKQSPQVLHNLPAIPYRNW